jgi:hypothetical protein
VKPETHLISPLMSIPIIISDRNTKNYSCSKSPKNNLIAVQLKISKEQDKTPHISSQVKIVHLNIRSLKNKTHFIEITNFIKLNNVDVLTLSETWLNTTTKNYEIAIEGYKLFRLDRLRKKGGGVYPSFTRTGMASCKRPSTL